ncbi:hypothetical protein [Pontibacter actiniarum]|uniref:Uncharacterized protein n=1 Tax=Pontibacter actiniarum TaxID=323450 RepID=A0A1X9YPM9_9BACT|nr:hypothetical protein [Pontibacter actiniarum]ARS34856.1 hypothetical protein CA264_05050 [Pontibacter actiniarum]
MLYPPKGTHFIYIWITNNYILKRKNYSVRAWFLMFASTKQDIHLNATAIRETEGEFYDRGFFIPAIDA